MNARRGSKNTQSKLCGDVIITAAILQRIDTQIIGLLLNLNKTIMYDSLIYDRNFIGAGKSVKNTSKEH